MRFHHAFPLLPTSAWPESIQWPTRYDNPDFTLLAANPDTPPGCIGLHLRRQPGATPAPITTSIPKTITSA